MIEWPDFMLPPINLWNVPYQKFYRKGGRAVECTGFEHQQGIDSFVGSNPTPSANKYRSVGFFTGEPLFGANISQK